jgi:hypothetical protein
VTEQFTSFPQSQEVRHGNVQIWSPDFASFVLSRECRLIVDICLWPYSPFVGPCPLFRFLNPLRSRQDSLDGGSARRKAAT